MEGQKIERMRVCQFQMYQQVRPSSYGNFISLSRGLVKSLDKVDLPFLLTSAITEKQPSASSLLYSREPGLSDFNFIGFLHSYERTPPASLISSLAWIVGDSQRIQILRSH